MDSQEAENLNWLQKVLGAERYQEDMMIDPRTLAESMPNTLFSEIVKKLNALSNESRLKILYLIHQGELSGTPLHIQEMGEIVGISQPNVSSHLRVLRDAGIIFFDRRGKENHYYIEKQEDSPTRFVVAMAMAMQNENNAYSSTSLQQRPVPKKERKKRVDTPVPPAQTQEQTAQRVQAPEKKLSLVEQLEPIRRLVRRQLSNDPEREWWDEIWSFWEETSSSELRDIAAMRNHNSDEDVARHLIQIVQENVRNQPDETD